jgi:hypothetical protein
MSRCKIVCNGQNVNYVKVTCEVILQCNNIQHLIVRTIPYSNIQKVKPLCTIQCKTFHLLGCCLKTKIRIYKTIILPVVLYGCKTLSLTLREEHRLRVFENRDEVTGEWRKLHNEELHNLYSSPSIIRMIKSRRMRWAGHVA